LRRSGLEHLLAAGMVLTGGGAKIQGALDLAESIFQLPVRLGLPQNISGLPDVTHNPIYATSVGLLVHGYRRQLSGQTGSIDSGNGNVWSRMRQWFQGNL
jgi:cell division protein FtsA